MANGQDSNWWDATKDFLGDDLGLGSGSDWTSAMGNIGGIAGALGSGGPQAMASFVNKIAESQELELSRQWSSFQKNQDRTFQFVRDAAQRRHELNKIDHEYNLKKGVGREKSYQETLTFLNLGGQEARNSAVIAIAGQENVEGANKLLAMSNPDLARHIANIREVNGLTTGLPAMQGHADQERRAGDELDALGIGRDPSPTSVQPTTAPYGPPAGPPERLPKPKPLSNTSKLLNANRAITGASDSLNSIENTLSKIKAAADAANRDTNMDPRTSYEGAQARILQLEKLTGKLANFTEELPEYIRTKLTDKISSLTKLLGGELESTTAAKDAGQFAAASISFSDDWKKGNLANSEYFSSTMPDREAEKVLKVGGVKDDLNRATNVLNLLKPQDQAGQGLSPQVAYAAFGERNVSPEFEAVFRLNGWLEKYKESTGNTDADMFDIVRYMRQWTKLPRQAAKNYPLGSQQVMDDLALIANISEKDLLDDINSVFHSQKYDPEVNQNAKALQTFVTALIPQQFLTAMGGMEGLNKQIDWEGTLKATLTDDAKPIQTSDFIDFNLSETSTFKPNYSFAARQFDSTKAATNEGILKLLANVATSELYEGMDEEDSEMVALKVMGGMLAGFPTNLSTDVAKVARDSLITQVEKRLDEDDPGDAFVAQAGESADKLTNVKTPKWFRRLRGDYVAADGDVTQLPAGSDASLNPSNGKVLLGMARGGIPASVEDQKKISEAMERAKRGEGGLLSPYPYQAGSGARGYAHSGGKAAAEQLTKVVNLEDFALLLAAHSDSNKRVIHQVLREDTPYSMGHTYGIGLARGHGARRLAHLDPKIRAGIGSNLAAKYSMPSSPSAYGSITPEPNVWAAKNARSRAMLTDLIRNADLRDIEDPGWHRVISMAQARLRGMDDDLLDERWIQGEKAGLDIGFSVEELLPELFTPTTYGPSPKALDSSAFDNSRPSLEQLQGLEKEFKGARRDIAGRAAIDAGKVVAYGETPAGGIGYEVVDENLINEATTDLSENISMVKGMIASENDVTGTGQLLDIILTVYLGTEGDEAREINASNIAKRITDWKASLVGKQTLGNIETTHLDSLVKDLTDNADTYDENPAAMVRELSKTWILFGDKFFQKPQGGGVPATEWKARVVHSATRFRRMHEDMMDLAAETGTGYLNKDDLPETWRAYVPDAFDELPSTDKGRMLRSFYCIAAMQKARLMDVTLGTGSK